MMPVRQVTNHFNKMKFEESSWSATSEFVAPGRGGCGVRAARDCIFPPASSRLRDSGRGVPPSREHAHTDILRQKSNTFTHQPTGNLEHGSKTISQILIRLFISVMFISQNVSNIVINPVAIKAH